MSNGAGGNKLNVKKFSEGVWTQLGNENFTDYKVQHVSIAAGSDGHVYVAGSVFEDTNFLKNFVLAYDQTSNVWSPLGDYLSVGQGEYNSLVVDANGDLYIAFSDDELGKISVKKFNQPANIPVESVSITVLNFEPAAISIKEGTLQLLASILPVNAANTNVTWAITAGSDFATIDENGLVTALANGTATVTVTTEDGNLTATIDVVITGQGAAITGIEITIADNAPASITTNGGTLQLEATILPEDAAATEVAWSITTGSDFASIDENGLVTAIANGTVTVTVTTADGDFTDTIEIVVTGQVIAVTEVAVTVENDAEPVITTVGGTLQLVATVIPEDATNATVTWSIVTGEAFASVSDEGLVTAIAEGAVIVRATTQDGTVYGEITITIDIDTSSADEFNKNSFSVYPNPTAAVLNIQSAVPVLSVRLYDNLGREVSNTSAQSIDMSRFSAGIYILNATFDNGSSKSIKVIKK